MPDNTTTPIAQYATTTDGVKVAFLRLGEGRAIVSASNFGGDVHSYRSARSSQRGVSDLLVGRGWQVVLHDARGMGASDRDVSDNSIDGRVRDLEAVVDALGLGTFALMGAWRPVSRLNDHVPGA